MSKELAEKLDLLLLIISLDCRLINFISFYFCLCCLIYCNIKAFLILLVDLDFCAFHASICWLKSWLKDWLHGALELRVGFSITFFYRRLGLMEAVSVDSGN